MQFSEIIDEIDGSYDRLSKQLAQSEREALRLLLVRLRKLDLDSSGNVKRTAVNIRELAKIRARLESIVLNDSYRVAIKDLVNTFTKVADLQNTFFEQTVQDYKPKAVTKALQKEAAKAVQENLRTQVIEEVRSTIGRKLQSAITSGVSYADLTADITNTMQGAGVEPGQIAKYARTLATDSLNTFSREHLTLISSDLGYEWFRYQGSLIETSRPFCEAMVKKKFFHVSELDDILAGKFSEFEDLEGTMNQKTGLPAGLKEETTPQNFTSLAGGWNCGHQCRPVPEDRVPLDIRTKVYASQAYARWKSLN